MNELQYIFTQVLHLSEGAVRASFVLSQEIAASSELYLGKVCGELYDEGWRHFLSKGALSFFRCLMKQ